MTKLFYEEVVPVSTPLLKEKLIAQNIGLEGAVLLHVNPDDADWVLGNGEGVEDWIGDDGQFRLESFPNGQIWYMEGGVCVAT